MSQYHVNFLNELRSVLFSRPIFTLLEPAPLHISLLEFPPHRPWTFPFGASLIATLTWLKLTKNLFFHFFIGRNNLTAILSTTKIVHKDQREKINPKIKVNYF